jgi:hypothetical protein
MKHYGNLEMTDKKWETIFKRMKEKFKDGGDAGKIINETIILQVLTDIFDKDKTRTLEELAQEHSTDVL